MSEKSQTSQPTRSQSPPGSSAQELQDAGLGNMLGVGTVWIETLGSMGAEILTFMAERIREDVKTQQEIACCKTPDELQHIQVKFLQKAMDQYQAETGKLLEMGTKAFTPNKGNGGN